ncbi:MAG: Radical domain protein [Thermoleophilia bacterium]|jgi:DNA repair photolyase|nr:Radical domain protein [Thermoleophilia bacterium]
MARVQYNEQPARSALTRVTNMPFRWSLNPYTGCVHRCTFCFVRGFELRAGRPSDERYGRTVRVKTGIVELLRRELAGRRDNEGVVVGTATDPYQPAEGRYRLTRGCLRELAATRTPVSIITRGPLIVRDIDVLQEVARHADLTVNVSIPTIDEHAWRSTEPGTAPPRQRLRAMRMLVDAGIHVTAALAPLLPNISDTPASVEAVLREARAAGACAAWVNLLNLRPGVREHFIEALGRDYPEQVDHYVRTYRRPFLERDQMVATGEMAARLITEVGIADRRAQPIIPELQLSLL